MKKKLLIISNFFYPNVHIASFRIEAFAKYFRYANYDVTVVTEGDNDIIEYWNECKIIYVKDRNVFNFNHLNKDSRFLHNCKSLINYILDFFIVDKKKSWRLRVLKTAKQILKNDHFDIILSSYGYISSHFIGYQLKKENPALKWIVDMRDEMSSSPNISKLRSWTLEKYEKKFLNLSDLVISVSNPILKTFQSRCSHSNLLEIKNGYDFHVKKELIYQKHFTLSYVGSFYGNIKPDILFVALSNLKNAKLIPSNFILKIVGNKKPLDIPINIQSNVLLKERLSHELAIKEIIDSDVLLIIHPKGRKGVYTGKLFDYIAVNRTILALVDPHDVISDLLQETNAGYSVDHDDIKSIEQTIEKCYIDYQLKRPLQRNWENVLKYSRKSQIDILLKYIEDHWN